MSKEDLEARIEKQAAVVTALKEALANVEETIRQKSQERIKLVAEIIGNEGKLEGLKEALGIMAPVEK